MATRIKKTRLSDIKKELTRQLAIDQVQFRRREGIRLQLSKPEATTLLRCLQESLEKET